MIEVSHFLLDYFQPDDPFDYYSADCKFHLLSNKWFHRIAVLLCLLLFIPLYLYLWSVHDIFHNNLSLHLSLPWKKTYSLWNECKCKQMNYLLDLDIFYILFLLLKLDAWTSLGNYPSCNYTPFDLFNISCKPRKQSIKWVYRKLHAPVFQVNNEILTKISKLEAHLISIIF